MFAKSSNVPPVLPTTSSSPLMKPPSTMKPSYFDAIKKDSIHSMSLMWPQTTKQASVVEEEKMMPPPPALIPISRRSSASTMIMPDGEAELKTEIIDDVGQHDKQHDQQQSSLSPSDVQGVDLSMKTPLLRHLVDIPPVSVGSLGIDKYFPKGDSRPAQKSSYVYVSDQEERHQFLDEDLLRPPSAKIPSLEFSVQNPDLSAAFPRGSTQCVTPNSTVIHSSSGLSESSQPGFETSSSSSASSSSHGRNENFTANSSLPEPSSMSDNNSVSDYDAYPRVRISSMSQNYNHSNSYNESRSIVMRVYNSELSPMVLSNDCSIDNAMSSVVKQAVRDMEVSIQFNLVVYTHTHTHTLNNIPAGPKKSGK